MQNIGKNAFLWSLIIIVLLAVYNMFDGGASHTGQEQLGFSDFLDKVDRGQVTDASIKNVPPRGSIITGHMTGGTEFVVQTPDYPNLVERLTGKGVKITAAVDDGKGDMFWNALLSWAPILFFVGMYFFVIRQMQGGGGRGGA
ncbi:MAG: cell division protein FtsH, partial [Alphaproteobacteria bacterium]|nr:cell division protein FtsH [Alphaproteobacteria bacterium]